MQLQRFVRAGTLTCTEVCQFIPITAGRSETQLQPIQRKDNSAGNWLQTQLWGDLKVLIGSEDLCRSENRSQWRNPDRVHATEKVVGVEVGPSSRIFHSKATLRKRPSGYLCNLGSLRRTSEFQSENQGYTSYLNFLYHVDHNPEICRSQKVVYFQSESKFHSSLTHLLISLDSYKSPVTLSTRCYQWMKWLHVNTWKQKRCQNITLTRCSDSHPGDLVVKELLCFVRQLVFGAKKKSLLSLFWRRLRATNHFRNIYKRLKWPTGPLISPATCLDLLGTRVELETVALWKL